MTGTFLSFYFYFFLKEKIQTSAFSEFTESFLQYLYIICDSKNNFSDLRVLHGCSIEKISLVIYIFSY